MATSAGKHVEMLRRRLQFLNDRIAGYKGKSDSYDRAEAAALRWVLKRAGLDEREQICPGQVWRTPGALGEVILEVLGPPFRWKGETWVAVKRFETIAPSCESVSWILAGGKRDPVLERIRGDRS